MNSNKSKIVDKDIVNFIHEVQPIKDDMLGDLQKWAYENNIPIIDQEVATFLSTFLSIYNPKKILEIGCAIGFSTILINNSVCENSQITTIDRYELMIKKAKKNFIKFGLENKIKLIEGDAKDLLKNFIKENRSYDFIFLDSSKGQYINIISDCFELLEKNGVLIADDIFQNGNITKNINQIPKRQRTIHRRLNEFIKQLCNCTDISTSIIPIGDGLIMCKKINSNVNLRR